MNNSRTLVNWFLQSLIYWLIIIRLSLNQVEKKHMCKEIILSNKWIKSIWSGLIRNREGLFFNRSTKDNFHRYMIPSNKQVKKTGIYRNSYILNEMELYSLSIWVHRNRIGVGYSCDMEQPNLIPCIPYSLLGTTRNIS